MSHRPTIASLEKHPVHLGLGASACPEPEFTGALSWYEDYVARHAGDGVEGRLVSLHAFAEPWGMWEMHPSGDEVVICLSGALILHQDLGEPGRGTLALNAGEYAINPAGVWHTADVSAPTRALFITAGVGTQHRPR